MRTLIIGTFMGLFCSAVQALPESGQDTSYAWNPRVSLPLVGHRMAQMPVRANLLAETAGETAPQPESGSLVIPGEEKDEKDKKCLTVCKKWGEDCIINPRTGSRDCRRTCKAFGEECF